MKKTRLMLRVEKRFRRPINEILDDLYIKQNYGQRKCGKFLNVGKTTIAEWMKIFNIPQRDCHQPKSKEQKKRQSKSMKKIWENHHYHPINLSVRGTQVFLGSLLGDGSLSICNGGKHAYFKEEHSIKQEDYLRWKNKELNFTFKKYKRLDKRFDRIYESVLIYSRSSPFFTKYHKMLYINGKKTVTKEFLTLIKPLGLATFYCDDGNLRKDCNYITICTMGFDIKSLQILISWLKNKWKIHSELDKEGNTIIRSKERFVNLIKPFVPSCMNYKIDLHKKRGKVPEKKLWLESPEEITNWEKI